MGSGYSLEAHVKYKQTYKNHTCMYSSWGLYIDLHYVLETYSNLYPNPSLTLNLGMFFWSVPVTDSVVEVGTKVLFLLCCIMVPQDCTAAFSVSVLASICASRCMKSCLYYSVGMCVYVWIFDVCVQ